MKINEKLFVGGTIIRTCSLAIFYKIDMLLWSTALYMYMTFVVQPFQ